MAYRRGVFWGVVPYAPAAPFSVKLMRAFEDVASARELAEVFRRNDIAGEVPFEVRAKLRPVLALTEPSAELGEITALRLVNISRRVRARQLSEDEAREVMEGKHHYLYPVASDVVRDLSRTGERYAVIVDNPVILHQSAVTTRSVGEVSEADFEIIGQRFVAALGFALPDTP